MESRCRPCSTVLQHYPALRITHELHRFGEVCYAPVPKDKLKGKLEERAVKALWLGMDRDTCNHWILELSDTAKLTLTRVKSRDFVNRFASSAELQPYGLDRSTQSQDIMFDLNSTGGDYGHEDFMPEFEVQEFESDNEGADVGDDGGAGAASAEGTDVGNSGGVGKAPADGVAEETGGAAELTKGKHRRPKRDAAAAARVRIQQCLLNMENSMDIPIDPTEDTEIPTDYQEAVATGWTESIQSELDCLTKNNTWKVVERPEGNVIKSKWIFKRKSCGRLKSRLVACGYSQEFGVDY
jgi:hypothetical protein